jgi:hypothetical protein
MGMESIPNEAEETTEVDAAQKWLEFTDEKGMKTQVGVFEGETDEDALERARAIDVRQGNDPTF